MISGGVFTGSAMCFAQTPPIRIKFRGVDIMAEITVTEGNFEQEILKSGTPALVDFWATWCGPCRMLAPILSSIADERTGKLKVGKINVDEQPGLAAKYRVTSIPTLVLFVGGKAVKTTVGYQTKAQLEAFIDGNT